MQFGSQKLRQAMASSCTPTLSALRLTSRQRYQQALTFMQEWTTDLLERENELQLQRDQLYSSVPQSSSAAAPAPSGLPLQALVREELLSRIEGLYIRELAAEPSQSGAEDSLEQSNTFGQDLFEGSPS